MSDIDLYIGDILIDPADVLSYPTFSESLSFDSYLSIPDSGDIVLDNTKRSKYDPKASGSLLNNTKVFNVPVRAYDNDSKTYTLRGKIANVGTDSDNKLTISVITDISLMSKLTCFYEAQGVTPAEAIKAIILKYLGSDYIPTVGFSAAIELQRQHNLFVDISYKHTPSNNNTKTCGDVLAELLRIGNCYLYTYQNLIYLHQRGAQPANTYSITDEDVEPGSYSDYYLVDDAHKIKNSYRIIYKAGDTTGFVEDKDQDSIDDYGEVIFAIPDQQNNSSASEDYAVIITTAVGAKWCGDTAIGGLLKPILVCEFKIGYKWNLVKIGDGLKLYFDEFNGESLLVIGRDPDPDGDKITITGVFI